MGVGRDRPGRGLERDLPGPGLNVWNYNNYTSPLNNKFGRRASWYNAASLHTGGVNFVFADGSVRFVQQTIDIPNLTRLSRMADGEVISNLLAGRAAGRERVDGDGSVDTATVGYCILALERRSHAAIALPRGGGLGLGFLGCGGDGLSGSPSRGR